MTEAYYRMYGSLDKSEAAFDNAYKLLDKHGA